uniref:Uncharacterized protein n=1 Tax=Rhodnius prolixus TaxID=13249 RepID=T1HXH8_RHOPR
MEITPAGGVVKEATSMQQSSVEEFEKDVGSMHVKQKSSNFASEESSKLLSESVSQVSSSVVTSSVVKKSSVSQSFSSTSSSTTESLTFD